jgi:hypothetical protein
MVISTTSKRQDDEAGRNPSGQSHSGGSSFEHQWLVQMIVDAAKNHAQQISRQCRMLTWTT